jgi:hypothetical protein
MKVRAYAIGLAGIALIAIAAVAAARGAPSRQPSVPVGGDAVAHALVVGRDGLQLKAKGISAPLTPHLILILRPTTASGFQCGKMFLSQRFAATSGSTSWPMKD